MKIDKSKMSEQKKLTDLSFLRNLTGGNPDKMVKYLRMFLTGAPQSITQMELYALSKDWGALKQTAHALKPQLGYFGAKGSEDLVKQIEHNADSQTDVEQLPAMISIFREQFETINTELQEELNQLTV